MPAFINFLRKVVCDHDYNAPEIAPMFLSVRCTKCKKVRIGRAALRPVGYLDGAL